MSRKVTFAFPNFSMIEKFYRLESTLMYSNNLLREMNEFVRMKRRRTTLEFIFKLQNNKTVNGWRWKAILPSNHLFLSPKARAHKANLVRRAVQHRCSWNFFLGGGGRKTHTVAKL